MTSVSISTFLLSCCLALAMLFQQGQTDEASIVLNGPKKETIKLPVNITNDGLTDTNGTEFPWEQIVAARLPEADQKRFDVLQADVGQPLYRIEHRLSVGDWRGLAQLAESLKKAEFSAGSARPSKINLASFLGHIHEGVREEAAAAWINFLNTPGAESLPKQFPKSQLSADETKSGYCKQLLPLFFDRETARKVIDRQRDSWPDAKRSQWPWGAQVYFAALLVASGDHDAAEAEINHWKVESNSELADWKKVILARNDAAQNRFGANLITLENSMADLNAAAKLVGRFCLAEAFAKRAKTVRQIRESILRWLEIAATTRGENADLSAAAIEAAMAIADEQGWEFESTRLKEELANNYSRTYHGRRQLEKNK